MKKLIDYLKENGAVEASKVSGPNGAFISATKADGSKFTLPIGGKSQGGTLAEFNVLITDDGNAIATVNSYKVEERVTL